MILPNSALSWAATRSGLGFADFLSSLTMDKEMAILVSYNKWRLEKGLKPVVAMEPFVPTARVENKSDDDAEEQAQDEMTVLMESIADEIEEKEMAEAEELAQTMEEIDAIAVEDGIDAIAVENEIDAIPVEDDSIPVEDDIAPVDIEEDATPTIPEPIHTKEVPEEIAAALSKLPKEPDEQLYNSLLSQFSTRDEAIAAVKERIQFHTSKHRGTAGLRQFWKWLDPEAMTDPSFVPVKWAPSAASDVVATPATTQNPLPETDPNLPITTRLGRLPKEPDEALYEELLGRFSSLDEAVETVHEQIKNFLHRHRSTVSLRAFLEWLEEKRG